MKRYFALFTQKLCINENVILDLRKSNCFKNNKVLPSNKNLRRLLHLFVDALCILFITSCNQNQSASSSSDKTMTNLILVSTTNLYTDASPPLLNAKAIDNGGPQTSLFSKESLTHEALELYGSNKRDCALEKVNLVIQANPLYLDAYAVRARIYGDTKEWNKAQEDLETMLKIDRNNSIAKFNLIELKFMQKAYDEARIGFSSMKKDPELGDLASYKVFLCDLFSGHEDIAKSELDAFDVDGSNPSYYFGNMAWSLYHKRIEDAKPWFEEAMHIYSSKKIDAYSSSLIELGYLPLPSEIK